MALTLPWLESIAGSAKAQSFAAPKRFVPIFFPNGGPDFWKPPSAGAGAQWQLSSVLEPFGALKSKLTVISGLDNGAVFNSNGGNNVEPAHGRLAGAWLTCVDADQVRKRLNVLDANGVSVDQIMAAHPAFAGKTSLPSIQLGLSTWYSFCDGRSCSLSRSVSWKTETLPLFKLIDPTAVFNLLVRALPANDPNAAQTRDKRRSVLDAVLESAGTARTRLSAHDKLRLDEFLTSVRSVEQQVNALPVPNQNCSSPPKPNFPMLSGTDIVQDTATYQRAAHFDLMNDLLLIALQCDQTRIASYMLEDERSEYIYDFVPQRHFEPLHSTPAAGVCGSWHGFGQEGTQDGYASIVYWHVGKIAQLCERLDALPDGPGQSLLDNCVVLLGTAMHGQVETAEDLPTLLVGGGGGALKTDQHLDLGHRPLRDLHYTLMNGVFDMGVTDFGTDLTGAKLSMIDTLLA